MGLSSAMKDALKADFTASSLSQDNTRSPTFSDRGGEVSTGDMRSVSSGSVSQQSHAWNSPTQKSSPLASMKNFLKADLSSTSAKGADRAPSTGKAPTANTSYGTGHDIHLGGNNSELQDHTSSHSVSGSDQRALAAGGLQQRESSSLNSLNQESLGGATASKPSPGRKTPPYDDVMGASGMPNDDDDVFSKVPAVQSANNVTAVHPDFTGNGSFDDLMPSGSMIEDSRQLKPVVHERIVIVEVEEITREKHLERHVHHIQHHVVPIIQRDEGEEHMHHQVYPVSHVVEHHTGKPDDQALLQSILEQGNSSRSEPPRRSSIESGTIVYENVHHHYHNIIQPVIEKPSSSGRSGAQSTFNQYEEKNLAGLNESRSLGAGSVASSAGNAMSCPKCNNHAGNHGEANAVQMA